MSKPLRIVLNALGDAALDQIVRELGPKRQGDRIAVLRPRLDDDGNPQGSRAERRLAAAMLRERSRA